MHSVVRVQTVPRGLDKLIVLLATSPWLGTLDWEWMDGTLQVVPVHSQPRVSIRRTKRYFYPEVVYGPKTRANAYYPKVAEGRKT